jgi:hypothetical protein
MPALCFTQTQMFFQQNDTRRIIAGLSFTEPSHGSPPIRDLSYTFRKSPVAYDCVVGPEGLEPPTRSLWPLALTMSYGSGRGTSTAAPRDPC